MVHNECPRSCGNEQRSLIPGVKPQHARPLVEGDCVQDASRGPQVINLNIAATL